MKTIMNFKTVSEDIKAFLFFLFWGGPQSRYPRLKNGQAAYELPV